MLALQRSSFTCSWLGVGGASEARALVRAVEWRLVVVLRREWAIEESRDRRWKMEDCGR